MPSYFSTSARVFSASESQQPSTSSKSTSTLASPPPSARKAIGGKGITGSPLFVFAGFLAIAGGGLYFFQKLAYQRGTVLKPGEEPKSKAYRQY
jgi:hypothetical protein